MPGIRFKQNRRISEHRTSYAHSTVYSQKQYPNLILEENRIKYDTGAMLNIDGFHNHQYPSFTIEMETGTGKTYVYLRSIFELNKNYGFTKFIIVVPSVAIYEGVKNSFRNLKPHFKSLYNNKVAHLIEYRDSNVNVVRSAALSKEIEIILITLQSFSKTSNVLYKRTDGMGELLPIHYIQKMRPILILDEPQNMESESAKTALRTLKPLFALRYSATPKSFPNQLYRLSPVDAFRKGLVKKIQVLGVTKEYLGKPYLELVNIKRINNKLCATLKTNTYDKRRFEESEINLYQGESLFQKSKNPNHENKYVLKTIDLGDEYVEFEKEGKLRLHSMVGASKKEIFRIQINETIKQHIAVSLGKRRKWKNWVGWT